MVTLELGLNGIGSHSLRHSSSELWMEHGASRDDLRMLFTHSVNRRIAVQLIDTFTTEALASQRSQKSFDSFLVVPKQTDPKRIPNCRSNPQNPKIQFTKCLILFAILGGGGRDRTDDPQLAKLVLSQLSYAPTSLECS